MGVKGRLDELDARVLGPRRKTRAEAMEAFSYLFVGAGVAFTISGRGVPAVVAWTVGIAAAVAATVFRRRDARA